MTKKTSSTSEAPAVTEQQLTKREMFSLMAMQGLLASGAANKMDRPTIAQDACYFADALIAELAKNESIQ